NDEFRSAREPVQLRGRRVGELVSGTPTRYVDDRLRAMLYDLVFALVVSLVLAREALAAVWERSQLKAYLFFETGWRQLRRAAARMSEQGRWLDWLIAGRGGVKRWAAELAAKARGASTADVGRELLRIRMM